ncbi:phage protein [Streptococcus pneumoniae]|nr:phage protein [Streptococcus pneumoniae]
MNKQELIEKYEAVECLVGIVSGKTILKSVLRDLQQLDEPEKVKVPQFVADWIEYCKVKKITLAHAFYRSEEAENKNVFSWIVKDSGNQETFAQAWIFGYEVEKEKRYLVKVKGIVNALSFLSYHKNADIWTVTDKNNSDGHRAHHTRKELEEAGFGWVFDCPGIEIEEVE